MGKSWWLTSADGKAISQKSRVLNLFPTNCALFILYKLILHFLLHNICHLELCLKLFQFLQKKTSRSQPERNDETYQMSRKQIPMWTDQRRQKKTQMRKDYPTLQRGRQDTRAASCERQLKHDELCLHIICRQGGSAGLQSQEGAQGQTSGNPWRSHQVWEVRGCSLGRTTASLPPPRL